METKLDPIPLPDSRFDTLVEQINDELDRQTGINHAIEDHIQTETAICKREIN